jgi:dihydrofolate reductase
MHEPIVCADVTLDGFMTGPDNDLDFMVDDDELDQVFMDELTPRADAIVVGRKAFIGGMAACWPTAAEPFAQWMNETPKVVLSSTGVDVSQWENSSVASGDGVTHVKNLNTRPGRAIVVFGGAETVQRLVAAGLVDEFWLKVNPDATGRGGAVFASGIPSHGTRAPNGACLCLRQGLLIYRSRIARNG